MKSKNEVRYHRLKYMDRAFVDWPRFYGSPVDRATSTAAEIPWLAGMWASFNRQFFEDQLLRPSLYLDGKFAPELLGNCWPLRTGRAILSVNAGLYTGSHPVVNPRAAVEGRFALIADVVLHEMIHQWQLQTRRLDRSHGGHGPNFCAKCNDIGAALLLPRVTHGYWKLDRRVALCDHWPLNVRSGDHYRGALRAGREPRGHRVIETALSIGAPAAAACAISKISPPRWTVPQL
jgi:hypothetical protein